MNLEWYFRSTRPQVVATGFEPANLTVAFSAVHRLLSLTRMKSLSLVWYRRNILNGDQPSLHSRPHLTFTAGTIQSSSYDALDATVPEQEVGVAGFEATTSASQMPPSSQIDIYSVISRCYVNYVQIGSLMFS